MKMKRYFAPDSRQALRALRDDQGPDAVILSNRNVKGGVEIIAAMDYEEAMENVALDNTQMKPSDENNLHENTIADVHEIKKEEKSITRATPKNYLNKILHEEADENNFDNSPFEKSGGWETQEKENVAALNKIKDELAGLRNIMEAPLMQFSWGETGRVRPLYASLLKQLMGLGLSSKLSQSIAKKTGERRFE